MIISKTPMRISLLGGGTDYPEVTAKWGGVVLGSTINKYCFITCRKFPKFFDYKTRLSYSKLETVYDNSKIEHNVIRTVVHDLGFKDIGLEIAHTSDLPASSGTGSSSAFLIGLIHALEKLAGRSLYCFPYELYNSATHIEQHRLKEIVGYQDSAWAAFGGFNIIRWKGNTKYPTIEKIYLMGDYQDYLERSLMLFYTGISRTASDVASRYVPTLSEKEKEHHELMDLTEQGIKAVKDYKFNILGSLIHRSWEIKKSYHTSITNPLIDKMFDTAMLLGAQGGKLIGAGSGGCLLLVVNPNDRDKIEAGLEILGAINIPFNFEPNGSQIILC